LGDSLLELTKLSELANLPTMEGALSQLMGVIKAPLTSFVSLLNEIPSKLVRSIGAVRQNKQEADS